MSPDAQQDAPLDDPRLRTAVDEARAAAVSEAGAADVGQYTGHLVEDDGSVTHYFASELPGYRGWQWSVTIATGAVGDPLTVSEVVLLPGGDALVAPTWVPWTDRVRAGDLGVGDLLPTDPDDPRLVPAFLAEEDPGSLRLNPELGLGRPRVLSREARLDLAERWRESERGPDDPMARSAPGTCAGCGFYLPLAGLLSANYGACGNAMSPADSRVVHAEYGCGAHSEVQVERVPTVPVVELVYDDSELDLEVIALAEPAAAPEPAAPETDVDVVAAPEDADTVAPESEPDVAEDAPAPLVVDDVTVEVVEDEVVQAEPAAEVTDMEQSEQPPG